MDYVVFDLDGVLLNTEELVRQAYESAGAIAPIDVLSHEGVNWLDLPEHLAARVRDRKNHAYLRMLSTIELPWLPPIHVARWIRDFKLATLVMLTGAPRGTAHMLADRCADWPFTVAFDGMRTPDKMRYIHVLHSALGASGVYVDDQDRYIDLPDNWHFVHYTGQTEDELMREVAS